MFIEITFFKAAITQKHLMGFIGSTPHMLYCLIIPSNQSFVYGALYTENIEYLLNEYPVDTFEITTADEIKKVLDSDGCRVCGNEGFLFIP